ncbi:hydroxysqualene dehydroxylase HpnE [Noviherbaspirillum galbum]|uniref:NAD(P)-binding protein n=1 Tax=Noviherbaspirillum galbum TaxID=2709383 RepID=A0A6B3SWQ6_9BURK|nr:hydroxysqualene dehydroxylase HpnE [Noviherbaspirillum galbum]NEX62842.1 NAD(P)-binding protein [Noviherbaspirillum galbum]
MTSSSSRREVAVVGGGWAGCAAAVTLAAAGRDVTLFEAARTLGGRARGVEVDGRTLDNGQHILLGAYTETLALMRQVGVDPDHALLRLPLQMRYPQDSGGMDFLTPRLPAPFHMLAGLLRASGLAREDKLSLARFSTTARWMGWTLNNDCTVSELLDRFDQTDRLIRLMWRPLCLAALNTPPERASAKVFLHVLRDSIGARRQASDMLLPRLDLSALFPHQAWACIERLGGSVQCGTAVKSLRREGRQWRLAFQDGNAVPRQFDEVVLALPAPQADGLLAGVDGAPRLPAFEYEPITTCYLHVQGAALPLPFLALVDDPAIGHFGQFVFDRGQLDDQHDGVLAVVVSASSEAIALGRDALAQAIAGQLAAVFRQPALAKPGWFQVISEKRATFSCTPGLERPACDTGLPGLVLAGDYTASDYPATLETAVRSGREAAGLILRAKPQ